MGSNTDLEDKEPSLQPSTRTPSAQPTPSASTPELSSSHEVSEATTTRTTPEDPDPASQGPTSKHTEIPRNSATYAQSGPVGQERIERSYWTRHRIQMASRNAQLFGWDNLEHFMLCYGLDFENKEDRRGGSTIVLVVDGGSTRWGAQITTGAH